jgi:hypothetical protein
VIRYNIPYDELIAAIDTVSPTWRTRATERTNRFRALGKYAEEWDNPATGKREKLSPFWSDIKPVYMRFQQNKCIYCETKLEGQQSGVIQWDLEHFRPKGNVDKWPSRNSPYKYDFATGDAHTTGYYLLAYHPGNYAAACKTCNSPYKSDYFPIQAARILGKDHPSEYDTELPFLLYPFGLSDDDPETFIAFNGAEAVPHPALDALKARRARVMIDFLGLNRDALQYARALWLFYTVWPNFTLAEKGDIHGQKVLKAVRSERSPFANCTRCFITLCEQKRSEAEAQLPILEDIIERFG